jgi:GNAT superfamily N-acetyltransferase
MIEIVPAGPDDVPEITALIHALADYERLADACVATEDAVRATLFGARPAAEVVLARHDGAVAGFALFVPNYSTFLAKPGIWLEDLFVRPAHRGQGIGRALLRWLAAEVVRRDGGRLEWAVLDWNVDAIGFYESLGARRMTEWQICRVAGDALATLATEG